MSATPRKRRRHYVPNHNFGWTLQEEARKVFYWYDLIIVLEWLHDDPEYAGRIEDLYFNGVRGFST